jgi:hypothetical protein
VLTRWLLPAASVLLLGTAPPQWRPAPGETPDHFAARVLSAHEDDVTITDAHWNGRHYLFVYLDRDPDNEDGETQLIALEEQQDGAYRRIDVTTGEQEGGKPDLEAIGFANADKDARQELIVIFRWDVHHYDVAGDLFEVRLFDDPVSGQPRLAPLTAISRHFDGGCECDHRDGPATHFRFKTIAAVKRELKRLGY